MLFHSASPPKIFTTGRGGNRFANTFGQSHIAVGCLESSLHERGRSQRLGVGGWISLTEVSRDVGLDPVWSYNVTVCGFTFEFWSVEQIEEALKHFSQQVPASPRYPMADTDFLQSHRNEMKAWFERLPAGLHSRKSKDQIVKALSKAIEEFRK